MIPCKVLFNSLDKFNIATLNDDSYGNLIAEENYINASYIDVKIN